jgi:periplasmic protein CpxP/Spy
MKHQLIALTAVGALSLGTLATVHAEDPAAASPHRMHRHGHGEMWKHHHGNPLDRLTSDLNLTADQQAKVQPIIDQTKPQIKAIHQEAMDKMKTVMENAMTQIRPLLTPAQQAKLDAIKKAHEEMRDAHQAMREAEEM